MLDRKTSRRSLFYPMMGLTIALVAVIGFSRTVVAGLINRPSPPILLYIHVPLFVGWVTLFIVQGLLVNRKRIKLHRRLGVVGLVIGALMPPVTLGLKLADGHSDDDGFLIVTMFDLLAFALPFWLAMYWRRRADYHRRLMLMATCSIASAAFARWPDWAVPQNGWYLGVDLLLAIAMARDAMIERSIHPVYRYGVPLLVTGQMVVMFIYVSEMPAWISVANRIFGA
jgi:hypothetical protein